MGLELISNLAAIVLALVAVYVAWRKTPAERRDIEGSAADKFEQIAGRAALRIDTLEKRVDELERQLKDAKSRIGELEGENGDLRDWAERLVHQVRSLGQEPVKLLLKGNHSKHPAV